MEEVGRNRKAADDDAADASETLACKRGRAPVCVADVSGESLRYQEKRCRVADLRMVFLADKEAMKGRAGWRNPDLRAHWDATHAPAVEGVRDAIPAWIVEECNRVLGRETSEGGGNLYGGLASAAKEGELND